MQSLTRFRIPDFGSTIKGPRHNLVTGERRLDNCDKVKEEGDLPIGIVEGHSVDDILVLLQREQLLATVRVPHLAGPVVATSDELVPRFVEGAVGQGQEVSSQHFEEPKLLLLVFHLLFD